MFKKFLGLTMAILLGVGSSWAAKVEYSFTIQTSDFNTTSYAANNGSHDFTAKGTLDATKTMTVSCTSNQVMQSSSVMQWQKSAGYIFNTTELGTIKSVTVNNTAGTFTTNYGTSAHPTSGTTVGNGFFTVKVGSATGKTSSIVVVFEVDGDDPDPTKTLESISVSGTPATFWKGDAFNHNGITVMAKWKGEETETDVTSSATFEGYDMSTPGNQTVTVTYQGKTATYGINVQTIANTEATAYTTTQAIALIDAGKDLSTEVYVKGVVSKVEKFNSTYGSITYWLDDDAFEVYGGLDNNGEKFSSIDDVVVDAQVVVKGKITKYGSNPVVYEFSQNSWLVSYTAPSAKTITALEVSGTPTKTTYNAGDAFETAGLVVTATYSDETSAPITTGFDWEIDYGTGHDALVAGATSVDVMVYTEDNVMSEVYTVNGLTVNAPVTLTSVAVSGTPTKTSYYAGDAFETAGLVVTGTYSDSHQEVITEGIEWTVDPETLAEGATSVDVMAGVGSVVSEVYTVTGLTVTKNPYKTATITSFSATSGDINTDISYEAFKGNASTDPAIYNDGVRLYQNGGYITITANNGLKIASVKITTTSEYASTTVGYCVDNEAAPTTGEPVNKESDYIINGLNNSSVSIYCLGTDKYTRLEIAAIEVKYTGVAVNELKSIVLSGTYPTEFTKGDEFSHEGMVVTAKYTVNDDADVTSSAIFSGYDMNTIGEHTVTVSYTENEITKTATYTLTVKKAPFVPTHVEGGVETVDFTTIDPYKSLSSSGSADMTTYEGTSFSIEFAKKTGTNNAPKFYKNGNAVRVYVDNTLTIKGADPIAYVEIAWTENNEDDLVQINGLGSTTAVVTFSKTCRFTEITVYYYYPKTFADLDLYTLYLDYEVAIPAGVHAYIGTKHESGNFLELTEIENVIPAKEAVLIQAESAEAKKFEISDTKAEPSTQNELKGVSQNTLYSNLNNGNILTLNTYEDVVGFYLPKKGATVLKANRCYLPMGENAAVRIVMPGNNPMVTGVEELNAAKATKALVNGKLVIKKGAKTFNANGMML